MLSAKEKNILKTLSSFEPRKNYVAEFHAFDIKAYEKMLREKGEEFWVREGEKKALKLFHEMAERVPAYKDFLEKNKVRHESIKTIIDFTKVPVTDKKNYIEKYSLAERCWNGSLSSSRIIAASSGTTGEPKFWPRGSFQEFEAAVTHESYYRHLFDIEKYRTLLVIGFPMGVYISGMATTLPSFAVAEKGYDLTIATAGLNKEGILKLLSATAHEYEQVIFIGHPFFVKDVIESAEEYDVDWKKLRLKIMLCSEGFKESWREYLSEKSGRESAETNIFNTYGSSEMLLMACETPMSISAKRISEKDVSASKEIFSGRAVPNLFQYNPLFRYIESTDERKLIFTSASGIPLARFSLEDEGEILPSLKIEDFLHRKHSVWKKELAMDGFKKKNWKLPFVSLYGRANNVITFNGINMYPEHFRQALDHKDFLQKITGKFVLRNTYKKNLDQLLEINIELSKNTLPSKALAESMQKAITEALFEMCLEYRFLVSSVKKDFTPKVILWKYQDEKYFKPGMKPKYIAK